MSKIFSNVILFLLLVAVFLAAVLANNTLLKGIQYDLSEDKVFSLSEGSQIIAANLHEPITLYYFFSDDASTGMTSIRDYASRVESLLQEYERLANGQISIEYIDPVPFSEDEDRAASFGLTAASTGLNQDSIYFGLAGTNSVDDMMVIGFFDPQKESFLEYDISSLLHKLNTPESLKLTIVSDLQLAGGQNPLNGQISPANVLYQQLQELFEIELVSASSDILPIDTKVLMLWHPQNIQENLLRQIDNYIISGGRTLALIDPHYESDPMAQMGAVGANSSVFPLLKTYGIDVTAQSVVLDALTGLEVRSSQTEIVRHLGFLGLGREQINGNDITSSDLDLINGASFASLNLSQTSQLAEEVLLTSSPNTSLIDSQIYASTLDVKTLANEFNNQASAYTLAARYSGTATPHFADKAQANNTESAEKDTTSSKVAQVGTAQSGEINIVVIGDADIAADRFWVQQSSFFGQTVFSPFANNGDFITNVLENLAGNENLIGIRGRGSFNRPFERVQALQLKAEEEFREQEKRLQTQLEQTEAQLSELQTQGDSLILSPEQEAAIAQFTEQKIAIRKSLRDVQYQLDNDINKLGLQLKLVNIAAAPVVLVVLLFLLAKLFKTRAPKQTELVKKKRARAEPSLRINPDFNLSSPAVQSNTSNEQAATSAQKNQNTQSEKN